MAGYRLLIKPAAKQEIEALEQKSDRLRVVRQIAALASEPRPSGSQKLAGVAGRHRIRQGALRVAYAVDDASRSVEIVKVGQRREVRRRAT